MELKTVFGIDRKTFFAWVKLRDETGEVAPHRPPQVRRRKIDKEKLRLAVQENQDAYLDVMLPICQGGHYVLAAGFFIFSMKGIASRTRTFFMRRQRRWVARAAKNQRSYSYGVK